MSSVDYKELKKELLAAGEIPPWMSSNGVQLFYEKYSYKGDTYNQRITSGSNALARHAPPVYPEWWEQDPYTKGKTWAEVFKAVQIDGFLTESTPAISNGGTNRGMTVSCSGQHMRPTIYHSNDMVTELAVLSKYGHGTSVNLDEWPCAGTPIGDGNFSSGVMPLIKKIISEIDEVSQGVRRGSVAYYINIEHGDFYKVAQHLFEAPDGNNVGWLVSDSFIAKLSDGDEEAIKRFSRVLFVRMAKGKGYICKVDNFNRHLALPFKRDGETFKASNLCLDMCLPSSDELTYTCVLLSLNLLEYDNWPKNLPKIAHIMQDCNVSSYLEQLDALSEHNRRAMQKAYAFTSRYRSVGTGVYGFHSLLMKKRIVWGSLDSFYLNGKVFKDIYSQIQEANKWLAVVLGEPSGCKGLGVRNATTTAGQPTKSSAELSKGSPSESINPTPALVKIKESSGGELYRIDTVLLEYLKEQGLYTKELVQKIARNKGSVKGVAEIPENMQRVFATAFEVRMEDHLNLCSQRRKYIDNNQSLNLYFTSNDTEEAIANIHKQALLDDDCGGLYYCYSMRGGTITRTEECVSCQ